MNAPIEPARYDGDGEPIWPRWIGFRDADRDPNDHDEEGTTWRS